MLLLVLTKQDENPALLLQSHVYKSTPFSESFSTKRARTSFSCHGEALRSSSSYTNPSIWHLLTLRQTEVIISTITNPSCNGQVSLVKSWSHCFHREFYLKFTSTHFWRLHIRSLTYDTEISLVTLKSQLWHWSFTCDSEVSLTVTLKSYLWY
jgi:hypothetical protein